MFIYLFAETEEWYQNKLSEYSTSFTIHGLSRTIHTDSYVERLFWLLSLLMALGIAFLMVRSLFGKFWTNDVYWNTETKVINKGNPFPAVTLCLTKIKQPNVFCTIALNNPLLTGLLNSAPSCNTDGFWEKPMNKSFQKTRRWNSVFFTKERIVTSPKSSISVECPDSGDCMGKDLNTYNFRVLDEDDRCITWNYKGTFANAQHVNELRLKIEDPAYKDKATIAFIHDYRESPISTPNAIPIAQSFDTEITIKKTVKRRLQRDPPNSCEEQYHDNRRMIFPGRYTVAGCLDSYVCVESLKRCGDVFDYCRNYIPGEIYQEHFRANLTYGDVIECYKVGFEQGLFYPSDSRQSCPPPCESVEYSTQTSVTSPGKMVVSFRFAERNVYEFQEEKQIYTWEDFVSGIGGMIGLFCGFSILSLAELFVYLGLKMMNIRNCCSGKKLSKKKKKKTDGEEKPQITQIKVEQFQREPQKQDLFLEKKTFEADEEMGFQNFVCS